MSRFAALQKTWFLGMGRGRPHGVRGRRTVVAGESLELRMLLSTAAASQEFQISPQNLQRHQSTAMDAAGNSVVTWQKSLGDANGYDVYARRYNAAGAPAGAEFRVNVARTGGQHSPSVAMDADGDFVVTWSDTRQGYEIYARRYNAAGAPQGGEFRVSLPDSGRHSSPATAMDAEGDFVVTYLKEVSFGEHVVMGRLFNAVGIPQGEELPISGALGAELSSPSDPQVATDADGDFVVTWWRGAGQTANVYARRYDASGAPQGAEFQVNQSAELNWYPAVAANADGDFIIAWETFGGVDNDVVARRYDAAGAPLGNQFRTPTTPTDGMHHEFQPAVAMNGAGDFVVSWTGGPLGGVYGRRYSATGATQGNPFPLRAPGVGFDSQSDVEIDAAGNVLATWARTDDNFRFSLHGRRFLPSAGPLMGGIPASRGYVENALPVPLAPAATVTDSLNFAGGVLTVRFTAGGRGDDRLLIGNGANNVGVNGDFLYFGATHIGAYTGGTGITPLRITFNAQASASAVQAVLRSVVFQNLGDNPTHFGAAPSRTVNFALTDGDGGISPAVNQTLNIIAVNDPPVLDGVPFGGVYTENAAPRLIAPSAAVVDLDSANLESGRLTIKFTDGGLGIVPGLGTDRLTIRNQGTGANQVGVSGDGVTFGGVVVGTRNVNGGVGRTPLIVTFHAAATPAIVRAVLRNIQYENVGDNPTQFGTAPERAVNFLLTDGDGGTSVGRDAVFSITALNDKPVLDGLAASQTYTENAAPRLLAPSGTVVDHDSANFDGGRLTVKYTTGGLGDRLTIRNQGTGPGQIGVTDGHVTFAGTVIGTVAGGNGQAPLVVTFNGVLGAATPAVAQALLRNIQYENIGDNPTNFGANPSRTLSYLLVDGDGGTSVAVNQTLNIIAVNDATVVSNFDDAVTYTSGAAPLILDGNARVTDADSADFAGGSLSLQFAAGGVATNRLAIRNQGTGANQIGVSGSNVTFAGTVIGTLNANAGVGLNALIVTFTSAATPAAVQALLRNLTYQSTVANPTGPKTLTLKVRDGDGGLTTVNKMLNIAPALLESVKSSAAFAAYTDWHARL